MRAQLARNEEARDELADCLLQERRRIEAALAEAQDGPSDRRAALERMLAARPTPAAPEFPWLETLPSAEMPESEPRAHVDLSA
ncbi:MAG: hypothetical protein KGL43_06485 [Burkholderiales bacterium]|nr:hypothetical protein [Burkholderiales bacterium]MDE2453223.1 hypothetical protein [Burkholderiales bacterium]